MTEPDTRTHGEILLDLVRSRTSALGDKQWGMDELTTHTGLRPHQVSNAIARMNREAKRDNETPLLRVKTGTKGQYVYAGPLKRGRKPVDVRMVAAAEVPAEDFTEENIPPLEDEGQIVAANEAENAYASGESPTGRLGAERQPPLQNLKPTLAEGFAQVGEKFAAAMGDISQALGRSPEGRRP